MKRSKPLRSKTPLSAKKWTWLDHYRDKKANTLKIEMECPDCMTPYPSSFMEPHHPAGRQGANLLRFVWLCRGCHREIHDKGRWARETGRLLPEFDSRKSTKNTPNFFKV